MSTRVFTSNSPRSPFLRALICALRAIVALRNKGGRAGRPLRGSEEHFDLLVEHSSDIITVLRADGTILYQSPSIKRVLGYEPHDRIGKNVFAQPLVHPDDLARKRAFIADVIAARDDIVTAEFRLQHADGSWRYIEAVGRNLLQEPSIGGIVANYRDITERKQAEMALRAGEERLRAILDNTTALVYVKDLDGRFVLVNRRFEELFHVAWHQLVGRTDHDIFPPEMADTYRAHDLEVLEKGMPLEQEEVAAQDDSTHTYISVKFPLRDANGTPYAVCGISTDITERKQAEQEIQQLNTTLERRVQERTGQLEAVVTELNMFAYSMAHDLRAPLRGIEGFAQALLDDYADQLVPTGQDYAHRIVGSARHLDTLIQDVLAYHQLGDGSVSLQSVDLSMVVRQVLTQIETTLRERQAHVTVAHPLPHVLGHPTIVVQVLTNLLLNAITFVAPGTPPHVHVWAEARANMIRLWVADNGIGIAAPDQQRIWNIFERLHGRETYPGTGIGLAIVRKGVERMGGQVGVESELGGGSRFWIDVPAAEAQHQMG